MNNLRLIILSASLLMSAVYAKGQHFTKVSVLDNSILETSGLLYLDQRLITHNDSGDEPALYEIDTISGGIGRKVIVKNAVNQDWEDLCCDSIFIYIGDFGNNYGNRKDLRIYRVLISDYLTSKTDSVDAEVINFRYTNQSNFRANPTYTNFDTEALISYNDSLYIFTKNWGDNLSYIYSCPKQPGSYNLDRVDVINAKGLITGATFNKEDNTILFCGYIFSYPFLMELSNFTSNRFSDGRIKRYLLPLQGSTQIEGITMINPNRYFFSSEANKKGPSTLYGFDGNDLSLMKQREKQIGSTLIIQLLSLAKDHWIFKQLLKAAISLYI